MIKNTKVLLVSKFLLVVNPPSTQASRLWLCDLHFSVSKTQLVELLLTSKWMQISRFNKSMFTITFAPTVISNYPETIKKSTNCHHWLYLNYEETHPTVITIFELSQKNTNCHHQLYFSIIKHTYPWVEHKFFFDYDYLSLGLASERSHLCRTPAWHGNMCRSLGNPWGLTERKEDSHRFPKMLNN